MKPNACLAPTITLIILAVAFPALAFEYPLSSTSVRKAYFQGAHADAKLDEFLRRYTANPPMPKTGQFHISMIRMQTPYEQVVERVMQNFNYDEQSAQRDFTEKPVAFRVRVEIHTTPSYKGRPYEGVGAYLVKPSYSWTEFNFKFSQQKEIPRKDASGTQICLGGPDGCVFSGWYVDLAYDIDEVKSAPAEFKVAEPDGETVEADFDLDTLQ